jgi:hypothetical protein
MGVIIVYLAIVVSNELEHVMRRVGLVSIAANKQQTPQNIFSKIVRLDKLAYITLVFILILSNGDPKNMLQMFITFEERFAFLSALIYLFYQVN